MDEERGGAKRWKSGPTLEHFNGGGDLMSFLASAVRSMGEEEEGEEEEEEEEDVEGELS